MVTGQTPQSLRDIKMRGFLQVWAILQSLGLAWCDSCLITESYVCKEIPTSYPPGLSSLVLWVSNIGEINSTVFNYTNLASVSSLSMRNTGITAISPRAFDKFKSLKMLDLYKNSLSQVTSVWFTHKEALTYLNLSNNSIVVLNEDAFHGLSGLLRLNLSHNRIQTVTTGTLHSLGMLRHLDLSNNKLSHLSVDTLLPVNSSKICLSGNPWNCSYTEFTVYLRELQKASLLENEMEVVCESPACLRGVPVWNVSKCIEPSTPLAPTVGYNLTLQPTPAKPQMDWSVLISLIVVLCALVLVICVLSVLYYRKREWKHLHTIQPFPEEPHCGKQARSVCREAQENVDAVVLDLKKKRPYYRTEVLLKLDQTVLEPEKVSQIFQIYGSGIDQRRETGNRAKSAGPVLSRTDCGKHPGTKVEDQKHLGQKLVRDGKLDTKWVKTENHQREDEGGNDQEFIDGASEIKEEQGHSTDGKEELHRLTVIEHPQVDEVGDGDTRLETQEKYKENPVKEGEENEESTLEENPKTQEFQQNGDDFVAVVDNLTSSLGRQRSPQPSNDTVLPLEDSDTMSYLTIGTNAENQNPEPEQIPPEAPTGQVPSKPIRRVLTWPPTAVQWKKQWSQNQQALSTFPKLIYVTGFKLDQISTIPISTSPASPQHQINTLLSCSIQQDSGSGSVPAHKTVEPLKQICESTFRSYIQKLPNSAQHYAEVNDEAQSSIISHSPLINSETCSNLVLSSPLCEEKDSKADNEESVNTGEDFENGKNGSRKKMVDQSATSEQVVSKSGKQSRRRRETEGKKPFKGQRDQTGCDSRAPPSGGSPADDNLLVDNEYAFIDLLHEVVENHGRWTRDRWRQSHIHKQKPKHSGKSQ